MRLTRVKLSLTWGLASKKTVMLKLILILSISLSFLSCSDKKETNKVDLNNINSDGSFDYRRILDKEIKTERERDYVPEDDYFKK